MKKKETMETNGRRDHKGTLVPLKVPLLSRLRAAHQIPPIPHPIHSSHCYFYI